MALVLMAGASFGLIADPAGAQTEQATGVTLSLSPATVSERAGATTVTVTATLTGGTRADATSVTVTVGATGDTATDGTDYGTVDNFDITIPADTASATGTSCSSPARRW